MSLQDYWYEQELKLIINPTYETRLRITENSYIDSHKPNDYFIPLDELPEYKKDKKTYLQIKSRTIGRKIPKEKRLVKESNKNRSIGKIQKTSQPEILTDTDISLEEDSIADKLSRQVNKIIQDIKKIDKRKGEDHRYDRNNKRIHINNSELRNISRNNSHTSDICNKEPRNILPQSKGIRKRKKVSFEQESNPDNTYINGKRPKMVE